MPASGRVASLVRSVRGRVSVQPAELDAAGRDGSHITGRPLATVAPRDEADVVRVVEWARDHRVALVPRGAGTSLDGESVPLDGSVAVDFRRWNRVLEVDADGRWARVGPGLVNARLQSALRPHGLFFPPNPGSWLTSTIGGHVATNASGPRSFRYGSTRRWVRTIRAVLGTGETVELGSRSEKRSMGPDLLEAFIGSEGTLGIVTEVTVRLAPLPRVRWGVALPLPARPRLGPLAVALARLPGSGLSAVEYLDAYSARGLAVARGAPWSTDTGRLLLEVEADRPSEARRNLRRIDRLVRTFGLSTPGVRFAEADRLWDLRGEAGRVMDEVLGSRIREDVAVPPARVDELLAALSRIARREGVAVHTFAHLGEGNVHPNFVVDPDSPRAERIRRALYAAALRLGGTLSAEHGIGRVKRAYVARELDAASVRLLRALKAACDPAGILNPGKLYPPSPTARRSVRSPSRPGVARTPRA